MASTQDAIRRLTIQASAPGATQATAELQALAAAQGGVAVASATTERATTSLDSKFASIERRYNTALRNQQDYAKLQNQVNMAVAQNPALQDRANAVLAAAADRYGQVTGAQKAFGIASQTVNLQVASLASGLGVTGQILSAFGPWGFAAAVSLGAVQSALSLASEKAHELAQKSKEIREFSEATGLTTVQFQALRSEAGKFGIDSETLASGLTKFSSGFENLRNGSGDLLTQIRRINPAIAEQMQTTTDAATAFTLFGKAVAETDNIFQRNALLKAGMGKGSSVFGAFFETAPDAAKLGDAFADAGKGIEDNLIKRMAQLQIEIDKTRSAASTIFAKSFGESTLNEELAWAKNLVNLANAFKSIMDAFSHPPAWIETWLRVAQTGSFDPATQAKRMLGNGLDMGAETSSSAQAISDAVPRGRTYDQIVADQVAGPPAPAQKTDLAKLAEMEKTIALLGSAATATEKYNLAVTKLKMGTDGFKLSADDENRAVAALSLDKATAQQTAHNTALGASTPIADLVIAKTQQLQKLQREGANLSPAQIKFQQDLVAAQALGTFQIDAQTKAEQVHVATLGMTAEEGIAYQIVQTKINENIALGNPLKDEEIAKLQKSADAYAKVKVAGDRYEDTMRSVNQATTQFADNLVQGLLKGGDAMATLTSGLGALGSSLTSIGSKNLTDGISGMLKGLGTSGFDPTSLGIGAVGMGISLISNIIGGDAKQRAELEKAQQAWKDAGPAFSKFLTEMTGGAQGNLAQNLAQQFQTAHDLAVKAWDAKDYAAITQIYTSFGTYAHKQADMFVATFDATLQGMADGLGLNSPFLTAVNTVKTQLTSLQQFVDDARVSTGIQNGGIDPATNQLFAGANGDQIAGIGAAVGKATTAAETYLLSLLQTAPTLSTVQTALQNMNGTATALQASLVQLGMSSENAAAEIKNGVGKALDANKAQFEVSLTERLNTANGQGYLNDATALLKQHAQDLADASALGLDPAQANAVFHAEAQKIVDDAGLVGDSFKQFIDLFPDFSNAVTAATAQLTASIKTINDYLASLKVGDKSTLSPQEKLNETQSQFNAQLTLAQKGNADAMGTITQYASTLLDQAKAFYASSAGYGDVYSAVTDALKGLTGTTGMAMGGIVPAYAAGGVVGNGVFGVDSVMARYAGGGSIGLAGGEFVMPAAQTQMHLPMLEAMRSGSASNDNGSHFDSLAQQLVRAMAGCSMGEITAIREENAALRAEIRKLTAAVEANKPKAQRPADRGRAA